ncbi:pyruvate dehydrogenase (acetyl-transferring) E1 component subunit alpha [Aeromicrobium terrae]|uniref:Pyruvate dehydrogenase (Acetyl-transferring) E1 component subunit alpha n=1 Tax=Aeromicrobium terrae TaxID=2498846 RepID=A0A5C8NFE3_9ACTN|nr:pyruvate dehydrogenase (acetyl-transferring) E1 component subunit alpha [Aeromicrobium terrae]TXL57691.1 pyruvate dehydrogenase (acetyl-transferring) E1 component subunit alpha [Aeromicrobium terrae]
MTIPVSASVESAPGADLPLVQLLSPEGERLQHPEFHFDGDDAAIRSLYRDLVMSRRIDNEAFALQRHGELGLWPQALGQEAAQVGSARALRKQDYAFPTYREHGVAYCLGVDPALALFRGVSLGGWVPAEHGFALISIIIGAHTLHATGYALGLSLDGVVGTGDPDRDAAVIAYFGDGASSQGDVNEAFDFAAVNHAPVVFFCQNNQYAISVPVSRQMTVPVAQRAAGFGFRGVRVDGNDVLACQAVTAAALQQARDGGGPMLIEAVTYRMGAHTTSDDASRYRDADEVEEWKAKDPIARVEAYLRSNGTIDQFFTDIAAEAEQLGEDIRAACHALPEPDLAALFDQVYTEQTDELKEQQAAYVAWRSQYEGVES